MHDNDYLALTGFNPTSWTESGVPAWSPDGFAEGFQQALEMTVQDCMYQRAMVLFPAEWLPGGFPMGMTFGRALIEARTEFLEHATLPPFGATGAYRNGDSIAVEVALTSLGRACPAPDPEDFMWMLESLAVLADSEPLVSEEGQGDAGLGGTLIRNHMVHAGGDPAEVARLVKLFTPIGAGGMPNLRMDSRQRFAGMKVVNSRTHGIGLLNPGEAYWGYPQDAGIESLPTLDAEVLGMPDFPVLLDLGGDPGPSSFTWLPLTEMVPRFRVRLEVVLPGHPRHRAAVLNALDDGRRGDMPDPVVICSVDYLSPLSQRGEGLDGPMIGGVSNFASYGYNVRREIAMLAEQYPHRNLADHTDRYLTMARSIAAV